LRKSRMRIRPIVKEGETVKKVHKWGELWRKRLQKGKGHWGNGSASSTHGKGGDSKFRRGRKGTLLQSPVWFLVQSIPNKARKASNEKGGTGTQ